jgi:hypothetical protein
MERNSHSLTGTKPLMDIPYRECDLIGHSLSVNVTNLERECTLKRCVIVKSLLTSTQFILESLFYLVSQL